MSKFKVGDKVRVVGSSDGNHSKWNHLEGFENTWVNSMNVFIGQELEVEAVNEVGVYLVLNDIGYNFPPQALELISDSTEKSQPKEQTYTEEQIWKAGNSLGYFETMHKIICELKKSTDPEYKLYMKLKEKFE